LTRFKGNPIRLGEGAVGKAVAIRAPVQIADALNDPEYSLERLRPIWRGRATVNPGGSDAARSAKSSGGSLVLGNEVGKFLTEAINLLQTFAAQSVLAIQNARLFRGIEEKSQQLEVANRHKSDFLARVQPRPAHTSQRYHGFHPHRRAQNGRANARHTKREFTESPDQLGASTQLDKRAARPR